MDQSHTQILLFNYHLALEALGTRLTITRTVSRMLWSYEHQKLFQTKRRLPKKQDFQDVLSNIKLKVLMFQLSYCSRFLVLKIKPDVFMIPLNFPIFPNNATLRSSLSDLSFPFWNQCWSLQSDWLSTERFNYDFFAPKSYHFLCRGDQRTNTNQNMYLSHCNAIYSWKAPFSYYELNFSSLEKDNLPLDR